MVGNVNAGEWNESKLEKAERTVFGSRDKRLFDIYGDIDSRNCADVAYDISYINMEDDDRDDREKDYKREAIRIYINSYGGSV